MGEEKEKEPKPLQVSDQDEPSTSVAVSMDNHMALGSIPSISGSAPNPSWFTPKRLLVIFCLINMINYVDRGAIASNGVNGNRGSCTKGGTCSAASGIQGDFKLSNFEDGVISSAFMVGLLIASPIFASLAKSVNPFRLIGVGLSVWVVATAGCGLSIDFWSISICRMFVGVGEASFISLAAPFIDDNAPVAQKTAWLGIFYMCIPCGVALGYVYGGVVGGNLNWRYAFFGEAILMLPFAILGFVAKPLQLKGFGPAGSTKTDGLDDQGDESSVSVEFVDQKSKSCKSRLNPYSHELTRFFRDMKILLSERVYVVNVLGYIAYNFVIGAYSYWGPKAGYNIYHMSNADLTFGGITVISGIFGTIAGGYVLDYVTSTIPNAFKLLSVATFFGATFCLAAFCFRNLYVFIALFAIGEFLVFATQGPVNFVCLHCVKPSLRPLSLAMSTVAIHIFGDVPSSPLVGVLQDHVNNWRTTALVLSSVLFIAAGIWFAGIFLHSVDRFDEENEHHHPPPPPIKSDPSNTIPLLVETPSTATKQQPSAEP